jgi:signal transduction histidine kinase
MLRRLVDALLEQVRSDRPVEGAQLVHTDISSLLEQCATLADGLAAAKDVQIVREIPSGLAGKTLPVALQSIVTNLLANAVEYSPAGTRVEMVCRLAGGQLEINVRDSGPGIAADALPHIFQPFYRVNKSRGAGDGHLGLGLFLVQSHARSLGGRCEVQSTVGEGTVFHVQFPLSKLTSQASSMAKIEDIGERTEIREGSHVEV